MTELVAYIVHNCKTEQKLKAKMMKGYNLVSDPAFVFKPGNVYVMSSKASPTGVDFATFGDVSVRVSKAYGVMDDSGDGFIETIEF
jgi:hypothetical protein